MYITMRLFLTFSSFSPFSVVFAFLSNYNDLINYYHPDKDHRILIFIHNLSFEFQWFSKLFEWEKVFALSKREVVYALTRDGVEFRCSYVLSGYSLAKLGDELTLYPVKKMVGDLDYKKIRLPKYNDFEGTYLTDEEKVKANGKIIKSNYKIKRNDFIEVEMPEPVELNVCPEKMNLDILYEDEDVLVVNKDKGVVVHPAPGNYTGTLVNGILYHCTDLSGINGVIRPGIVHRIDKDTSGILVIAKNDEAHNDLAAQFKEHSIKREYYALVEGKFSKVSGTVDKPISRDKKERIKMAINSDGKRAVTHYEVLEQYDKGVSLVKCTLETGRTHQIRVHMASIGHPLVGDLVYGYKRQKFNIEGQALHAKVLGFIHPRTKKYIEFTSELPEYFKDLLEKLRKM